VTGAPLLVAESLTAGYGRIDILHGVSLRVEANEIVSIIGPNGAGKSTAFKTVVGLLTPRRGASSSTARTSPGCAPTWCCPAGWPTCRRAASCSRR
jgi:ABC-type branched-subunit amino acid transport system ATPase component